jgi:hypothetical protein
MLSNIHKCEMLPLETKQSGGKLFPHLDCQGGSVSRGSITLQEMERGYFFRIFYEELEEVFDHFP